MEALTLTKSYETRSFKADIIDTPPRLRTHQPPTAATYKMASFIARRAFTTTARRLATGEEALKSETKKNPEIAVRDIPIPQGMQDAAGHVGDAAQHGLCEST